jgi:hypothetical protein
VQERKSCQKGTYCDFDVLWGGIKQRCGSKLKKPWKQFSTHNTAISLILVLVCFAGNHVEDREGQHSQGLQDSSFLLEEWSVSPPAPT